MSDWNLSLWPTPSLLSPGGYKLECFKSRIVQPWKVKKNKCVIKYNLIIFTVTIELGNALRWNYLSFLLHFRSNSSQSRWYFFVVSSVHMMVDGLKSSFSFLHGHDTKTSLNCLWEVTHYIAASLCDWWLEHCHCSPQCEGSLFSLCSALLCTVYSLHPPTPLFSPSSQFAPAPN